MKDWSAGLKILFSRYKKMFYFCSTRANLNYYDHSFQWNWCNAKVIISANNDSLYHLSQTSYLLYLILQHEFLIRFLTVVHISFDQRVKQDCIQQNGITYPLMLDVRCWYRVWFMQTCGLGFCLSFQLVCHYRAFDPYGAKYITTWRTVFGDG